MMRRIAGALLAVLFLTVAAGCGKKKPPRGESEKTDAGKETVTVMSDGVFHYRIVRSAQAGAEEKALVSAMTEVLEAAAGTAAELATDSMVEDGQAEILVGATNRQASREVYAGLGASEYTVCIRNGNIVIAGGSSASLSAAIDCFLYQLLGITEGEQMERLSLDADTAVRRTFDAEPGIAVVCADPEVTYLERLTEALGWISPKVTVAKTGEEIRAALDTKKNRVAVFAGAGRIPADAMCALDGYLKSGGRILTLGGPAFETVLFESAGGWQTKAEFLAGYIRNLEPGMSELILDTASRKSVDGLSHSSDNGGRVRTTIDAYGAPEGSHQLRVEVENLNQWDLLRCSVQSELKGVYGIGFWLRGSADTDRLYVEMQDTAGTRWYAVTDAGTDWEYRMLTSEDLIFWSGSEEARRAGPALNRIASVSFGFAQSGGDFSAGAHTYWLGSVRLLKYTAGLDVGTQVTLDGISPQTETYPVTNAAGIRRPEGQSIVRERNYRLPGRAFSCSPGRQGTGYGKRRANRFVPLLEYTDAKGLHCGYAAYLNLYVGDGVKSPYSGAVTAAFTASGNDFYDAAGLAAVADTAAILMQNLFLVEGGTDEYIYPVSEGGNLTAGASFAALDGNPGNAVLRISLLRGDRVLKTWSGSPEDGLVAGSGGLYTLEGHYPVSAEGPDRVVTTLSVNGAVIDRIEHRIRMWEPKPEAERHYVTTGNGRFWRDGQILNLFGVNYMPSTSTAEADDRDFEMYTSRSSYDPDVVTNDLLRIRDVGFNAVSVYVHYETALKSRSMLDLIAQCEELGLYVDLSIRPNVYPMTYSKEKTEVLIRRLHLDELDTVVAYDIAWEKRVDRYLTGSLRMQWDGDWRNWLCVQYGSVEAAERVFGCALPRNEAGEVIGATDAMLLSAQGGEARLVAAYRRFVDDRVALAFATATDHLRSLDPHHLISFRMAYSGSPKYPANYYAYDYRSLAPSLDFMSPEAYAVGTDDESALQVLFANAYARYAKPDSPVVWKEFGMSVWSGSNYRPSAHKLERQSELYRVTLDRMWRSGTAGVYAWFYGNWRVNEHSDYGILNPDGSDRPATALLREYAVKFREDTREWVPDILIEIERDDFPDGISGMFEAVKAQLAAALQDGKKVAFVDGAQIGDRVLYADETLNRTIHGERDAWQTRVPLRYVNGLISGIRRETVDGVTYLSVTVQNTLTATWRSGSVSVVAVCGETMTDCAVIEEDVCCLDSVTLRFALPAHTDFLRLSLNGFLFGAGAAV